MQARASGILLPVFSLPGPYGIGTLGAPARSFIDFLAQAGQKFWQILPLVPPGGGDSPYMSPSSFAGNPFFLDLEELTREGLLTQKELDAARRADPDRVDYAWLHQTRIPLLRRAWERGRVCYAQPLAEFMVEEADWLPDYALFLALRERFGGKELKDWPDEIRLRHPSALARYRAELADECAFHAFLQLLFFRQWTAVKAYANGKGISIIGDLPIYVSPDSAEVWSRLELFQLKEDMTPSGVAGVPPDAFSDKGQHWGNPLYDWAYHKKTGYAWWIQRVRHALGIYDLLRIDHFRGFDTYWAIPATSTTARTGKWENGPGMELFDALEAALGKLPIIAEDLGELFPSVRKLLADSTFPGMKVLQFAFGGGDNEYLPHNHVKNGVVYPGTHDNTTLTDWWENGASEKEKATAAAYLHLTSCKPTAKEVAAVKTAAARTALLRAALGSVADRAIIPMYDWLGLGAEAHLNTPGKLGGNWAWRAKAGFDSKTLAAQIKAECAVYCRCNADVQNVKELAI